MQYANYKTKIHSFLFIFTLILAFVFSGEYKNSYAEKANKVEEKAGLQSFTGNTSLSGAKSDGKKDIPKEKETISTVPTVLRGCDMKCKAIELIKIGVREEIANSLIINCKALADNPVMCIKVGASIVMNESGGGFKCRKYNKFNCFGIQVKDEYKSYDDAVLHFVGKWNHYWHKAKDMSHFYSVAGKLPPTRFCVSEHSTGTKIGCPAGLRNSTYYFNKLNF